MTTALGIASRRRNRRASAPRCIGIVISAQWASDGIIQGLTVTGGTGLTYTVSAGCRRCIDSA